MKAEDIIKKYSGVLTGDVDGESETIEFVFKHGAELAINQAKSDLIQELIEEIDKRIIRGGQQVASLGHMSESSGRRKENKEIIDLLKSKLLNKKPE